MDQKKVILISGASGALGAEIVKHFATSWIVVAQYNSNEAKVPKIANVYPMKCNLLEENEIEALVTKIETEFGRLDCLVNNAGISTSAISWKMSTADWNTTLAINLTAPFLLSKYAIPLIRKHNVGTIIFISSVVGQIGEVGTSAYAASKAGLFGLSKTLAKELAKFNITSNCIALGYFNTGMIHQLSAEMQEKTLEQIPLKTFGNPQALVETIVYLNGEGGKYTTGQVINLNGGLHS
jgi:3-oxoacyl-[acyl-carrier protein] reductase